MARDMTDRQKSYIIRLAKQHGLSGDDLDKLTKQVVRGPAVPWVDLNIHEASEFIECLLVRYGQYDAEGRTIAPPSLRPEEEADYLDGLAEEGESSEEQGSDEDEEEFPK